MAFCVEHQQAWFKKGAMKGYAHPIKDAEGAVIDWCNQPKEQIDTSAMEKSAEEGKPFEAKPEAKPASKGYKADPAKTSSIEKQTALIQACVLCAGGAIDKLMVITYAEFFHRWLSGNVGIPDETVAELFGKYVKAQKSN